MPWFTVIDGNEVAEAMTSGTVAVFHTPTSGSSPWGITPGPDGIMWFTENAVSQVARASGS